MTSNKHSGYFASGEDGDLITEQHLCRVVELGELLYNLQNVPGVERIYRRVITNTEDIEATILELEGLRLLWRARRSFRIVDNCFKTGGTYECDIQLAGEVVACCEMKCKVESTEFSNNTIVNAIEKARKQLPRDRCGIVILKTPTAWIRSVGSCYKVAEIIERVFKTTARISEVVIYARDIATIGNHAVYPMLIREVVNSKSPYANALGGGLIGDRIESFDGVGGIPLPEVIDKSNWINFSLLTPEVLRQLLEVVLPTNSPQTPLYENPDGSHFPPE